MTHGGQVTPMLGMGTMSPPPAEQVDKDYVIMQYEYIVQQLNNQV